jgi:tetratricopeptide (TPR) repeat protein
MNSTAVDTNVVVASPPAAESVAGWRFWLPRIAFAVVAPVVLLVLTEGALRLFHVGYSTRLMEPCKIDGRPSSCYNLFFAAPFFPSGMIKTPQFFGVAPQKPQHTYRIFVFGESAAMGDPDPAYSFSRYLEAMLRQRFPGTHFEVANTGMVAIDSHVSRIMARELAEYQPDLYIVYAGSNEVVGPYGPGTVLASSPLSMPVIQASILARSSRIGQLLTGSTKERSDWRGMEMFLDKEIRADSPRLEPAYQNFETNLRAIAEIARESRAKLLLSTVASNIRDSAPFSSMHSPDLSSEALASWTSSVERAEEFDERGAHAEALRLYLTAAGIDNSYAELHFRIARCQWALGDFAAAKRHYVQARDLDTLRFRADSRINDEIRKVAVSSGPSTRLLDTEFLFSGESPNGVIGGELFYDHVHFTPLGSYLLAHDAFEQIVPMLPTAVKGSAQDRGPLGEEECERLLAFTAHDRARVAAEMAERLQHPPFTQQLNHVDELQSLVLRASEASENPDDTVSQYQWAISQNPRDKTLHYKFGLFLFDYDRNAAAQELVLARPNDDFPVYLPDGTRIM